MFVDGEIVDKQYTVGGTFCGSILLEKKPAEVMLKVDNQSFGDCYETFLPETGGKRNQLPIIICFVLAAIFIYRREYGKS